MLVQVLTDEACALTGMFAIRACRKMATEKNFLEAVNKVIKAHMKFSATSRYMTYNLQLTTKHSHLNTHVHTMFKLISILVAQIN